MSHRWLARIGPGALILLVHLVLFALLVRYAGTPSGRDEERPAHYISFALIPEKARPKPVKPAVPPPTARKRTATVRRDEAAPAVVAAPVVQDAAPQEAQSEPVAAPARRLDMDALRSAARRAEQERVPTALERLRESEQVRSEDDDPLVKGIKRAKRPNCQTAYAGGEKANIFLLIPLAIDTIRDKGCKW
ncbi:hypothetical protein [Massilia sp. 9I]|uniref:hypothetical protein n=1 Tax=Massilia sp. 9I TaxID=2653152 RepID=UPI0012F274DA|nr:hypothetical protein [Massilia sp. 9I]VXC10607.1 conserved hypothetical protein [Massilia sp. 9I]